MPCRPFHLLAGTGHAALLVRAAALLATGGSRHGAPARGERESRAGAGLRSWRAVGRRWPQAGALRASRCPYLQPHWSINHRACFPPAASLWALQTRVFCRFDAPPAAAARLLREVRGQGRRRVPHASACLPCVRRAVRAGHHAQGGAPSCRVQGCRPPRFTSLDPPLACVGPRVLCNRCGTMKAPLRRCGQQARQQKGRRTPTPVSDRAGGRAGMRRGECAPGSAGAPSELEPRQAFQSCVVVSGWETPGITAPPPAPAPPRAPLLRRHRGGGVDGCCACGGVALPHGAPVALSAAAAAAGTLLL